MLFIVHTPIPLCVLCTSHLDNAHNWDCDIWFQAFLADDSLGRVDSACHCQVLFHQKSSWHTRPRQQVSPSICLQVSDHFRWIPSNPHHLPGGVSSCSPTSCSQSTFWSGCSWHSGGWSSPPCLTSSTWDAWILVFWTEMWKHLTRVSLDVLCRWWLMLPYCRCLLLWPPLI